MTTGGLARLAEYVAATRDAALDEPTRDMALRCVLDLLGAAGAGLHDTAACAVRCVATRVMGTGDSPVWFTGERGSTVAAAWANSAAASALDLDDGHRMARGHPGAAVIPAAFAVADECGATLDGVLRAIVIGYEVGVAIGAARTSYGNTGTWSAYAVAAAAAALRGTPADLIEHALAIAGESAPNQLFASAPAPRDPTPEGSAVKEGIPWSVVTGLAALDLAGAGHTGPRNILESRRHYRPIAFGAAPHIGRTYFKLYACCRHVHAPLDALLGLLHSHTIDPAAIAAVEVEAYSGALRISNRARPENLTDIQYSIPYCLGLAALRGPDSLLPLTEAALGQEDVTRFAERVALRCVSDLDAAFPAQTLARVTIVANDQRHASAVTSPRGEWSDPLGWAELEAKFEQVTCAVATASERAQLRDALRAARDGALQPLQHALRTLRFAPLA